MKIKIEIKNRWTGAVLFELEAENNTIAKTVTEAVKQKANLSEANLSEANLSKANLSKANLSKADLSKANLSWADLSEANLSEANLSEANLSEANLSKADLSVIKSDLWAVLLPLKKEIPAFKQAMVDGKIDGSTYDGECCCLVGTMENICKAEQRPMLVGRNSNRPAERWFLAIRKGDTPENNKVAKITMGWIEEFEMHINEPLTTTP